MEIQKIRYSFISKRVYTLLTKLHLKKYPINLYKVIDSLHILDLDIRLDTYSSYATFKKTSIEDISKNILKSDFGATAYIPEANLYIIFVNDTNQTEGRMNWTISHEIGHIILEHYKSMESLLLQRRGISDTKYDYLEKEADWFTQEFLCNPLVLSKCNVHTASDIKNVCLISDDAANNRFINIKNISHRYFNSWDFKILNHFSNFINSLLDIKFCSICGHSFYSKSMYCPTCNYTEGEKNMFFENKYKLDKTNKAIKCPKCENEDIDPEGEYCKICGTYLIQKCLGQYISSNPYEINLKEHISECSNPLKPDGNARYCPKCGGITSFHYQNLFQDWENENKLFNTHT